MTAWLDRIAADLLHVEQDLRSALRTIARGGSHPRAAGWARLTVSHTEARTLLRGAMPAPIAATSLRPPHGRLVAALSVLAQHLVALNDVRHTPDQALAAADQLAASLDDWRARVRWTVATRQAGVRWPFSGRDVSAIAVMRPAAPAGAERLPNAAGGRQHHPAAAMRYVAALRAAQAELDLVPTPEPSNVVELRQLSLPLAPRKADHAQTRLRA